MLFLKITKLIFEFNVLNLLNLKFIFLIKNKNIIIIILIYIYMYVKKKLIQTFKIIFCLCHFNVNEFYEFLVLIKSFFKFQIIF